MITIHLNNVKFFAYHGVHDEEKILGGEYLVDIDAIFEERVNVITDLNESINYSDLYDIASDHMKIATPLLETVAMNIGNSIHNRFSDMKKISVTIKKLHPPILHIQGSVGVSWNKEY